MGKRLGFVVEDRVGDVRCHAQAYARVGALSKVCNFRSNAPDCWIEYKINKKYAAVGRMIHQKIGPIFPMIEAMFGISIEDLRQEISATLIKGKKAEALCVDDGDVAIIIKRAYITADGTIAQITIETYPASRFRNSYSPYKV